MNHCWKSKPKPRCQNPISIVPWHFFTQLFYEKLHFFHIRTISISIGTHNGNTLKAHYRYLKFLIQIQANSNAYLGQMSGLVDKGNQTPRSNFFPEVWANVASNYGDVSAFWAVAGLAWWWVLFLKKLHCLISPFQTRTVMDWRIKPRVINVIRQESAIFDQVFDRFPVSFFGCSV